MKRFLKWVFPLLFVLTCVGTVGFLQLFTVVDGSPAYIEWDTSVAVADDGTETPVSSRDISNTTDLEGTYRFTGKLPASLPAGYLLFETSGLSLTLELDGKPVYASTTATPPAAGVAYAQVPLPEGITGTLTLTCKIVDGSNLLFPPLLRFMPTGFEDAQATAISNSDALPAGAAALAFVLVVGLLLLSCSLGHPDWSLVPLALAAAGLATYRIVQGQGYYFLPDWAVDVLGNPRMGVVTVVLLVVYLAMNRRRNFWKLLGIATAWSAAALAACTAWSFATDGYLASYLVTQARSFVNVGYYDGLVCWLSLWLTAVSALISAYEVLRSFADQQAREQGLALKNRVTENAYRALEAKMRETAAFRHEYKNQLTALDCLLQKEDYAGARALLDELRQASDALAQTSFTENVVLNTVLQDAAARARRDGTRFEAQVLVPRDLGIPEQDLCSLLMNMLDNALAACRRVEPPEDRAIRFSAKVVQGYLAVRCENSCLPRTADGAGAPSQADRDENLFHGFGIGQMEAVAEKYRSTLDISQTDDGLFTVQTALKIPGRRDTRG